MPVFGIFNVCTDVVACDSHGGCTNTARESELNWLWEKNPLPHWGLEPASVLRLAFQSDALPTELSPHPSSLFYFLSLRFLSWPCCFTSTEARLLIRDGDRAREWRLDQGYRPKKTGETVDRRQNNGSVKAVSPRHCAATSALFQLPCWAESQGQCPLHCCWGTTRSERSPTFAAQLYLPAHDLFWDNLRVQLHLPAHDLFWDNLRVQLHLPVHDLFWANLRVHLPPLDLDWNPPLSFCSWLKYDPRKPTETRGSDLLPDSSAYTGRVSSAGKAATHRTTSWLTFLPEDMIRTRSYDCTCNN